MLSFAHYIVVGARLLESHAENRDRRTFASSPAPLVVRIFDRESVLLAVARAVTLLFGNRLLTAALESPHTATASTTACALKGGGASEPLAFADAPDAAEVMATMAAHVGQLSVHPEATVMAPPNAYDASLFSPGIVTLVVVHRASLLRDLTHVPLERFAIRPTDIEAWASSDATSGRRLTS